jgi:hypothetical protein
MVLQVCCTKSAQILLERSHMGFLPPSPSSLHFLIYFVFLGGEGGMSAGLLYIGFYHLGRYSKVCPGVSQDSAP